MSEQKTTIKLGGYLGRRYGRVHTLYGVDTIQQAVFALDSLYPGFKLAILEKESSPTPYRYHVRVNKAPINEAKAGLVVTGKTVSILPIVRGAANKGLLQTIAGVVLIVAGVLLSGYGIGIYLIGAGISLTLGGIASLIAGTPSVDASSQDNKKKGGYAFSGPVNQTEQGGAVPVLYGELVIGSATVSGSIVPNEIVRGRGVSAAGGTNSDPSGAAQPLATVRSGVFNAVVVGGGGGGGDKGSTPKEDAASLISSQYAQILDLLSEGECEGLVGGLKGVYLNETPIENADGTRNFKDFDFYFNPGTQDQQYIPGFNSEEVTTTENVELKKDYPWTRHFSNTDLNAIRIIMKLPSLFEAEAKSGDIHGSKVELKFELQSANGIWKEIIRDTITGYAPSPYTRGYEIPLDDGSGPWNVRITRLTDDSNSSRKGNKTFVDTKAEVIYAKLRHPNRCMAAIKIKAEQFDSPPSRAFRMRGIKIKIPTNYNPTTRAYTGVWDGTFKVAWSDNPAWCWYDLLTNKRYGLGRFIKNANVDRYSLYRIAQYCDQLVPDSMGGQQPRFRMNAYIQTRAEALKVLSDMASNFRGMLYYINGVVCAVQDRSHDYIAAQYSPANVQDGAFTYSGIADRARHNTIYVRWNDPANLSKVDVEPAEDQADIAQNGINDSNVTGFGVATRGEARRLGEYQLVTEITQDETVTFKTGFQGGFRMPGDVIRISNPFRSGERLAGRISSVNGATINLDAPVTLEAGKSYKLSIINVVDDGTGKRVTQTAQKQVVTGPGQRSILAVASAFDIAPSAQSIFMLVRDDLKPELWRVLAVSQEGINSHEVTCIKYNASKYDAIDRNFALEFPPTSDLPNPGVCLPPGTITIREVNNVTPIGVSRALSVAWEPSPDRWVKTYVASYRFQNGNWINFPETGAQSVTLPITASGQYDFQVIARNVLGVNSAPTTASFVVDDESPISGFSVSGLELAGQANDLEWRGRDAKFDWRLNSPDGAHDIGSEPNGAASGEYDPMFKDFRINIVNPETKAMVWEEFVTVPNYTFTFAKNGQAFGKPRNNFTIEVRARDKFNRISLPASITVTNPPPAAPTALIARSAFQNVFLEFIPATDLDLEATEVLVTETGDIADAKIYDAGRANVFIQSGIKTGHVYTYWVRSRDTFGNVSNVFPAGPGVVATPGTVQATDIAHFAVNLTGAFGNVIVLQGDLWSDHSPEPAAIAWNKHSVFWQGNEYEIDAGWTLNMYVWWIAGETAYRTSQANPADVPGWLNNNHYQIAVNVKNTGVHELAWYGFANAVIGSAYIMNAAIVNAHIHDLSADKITAGFIDAARIRAINPETIVNGTTTTITGIINAANAAALAAAQANAAALAAQATGDNATIIGNAAGAAAADAYALALIDPTYRINTGITTIDGGKITTDTIDVNQLQSGSILTKRLFIDNPGGLQSVNYVPGVSGFFISGAGNTELNNVYIRGEIQASVFDTNCVLQNPNFLGRYFPAVSFGHQNLPKIVIGHGGDVPTNFFRGADNIDRVKHVDVFICDNVQLWGVGTATILPDGNRRLSRENGNPVFLSFSGNFSGMVSIWYRNDENSPWFLARLIKNPVTGGSGMIYVSCPAGNVLQFGVSTCNAYGGGVIEGSNVIRKGAITVLAFNF